MKSSQSATYRPYHRGPYAARDMPKLPAMVSRLIDMARTILDVDRCQVILRTERAFSIYSSVNGKGSGIRHDEVADPGQHITAALQTNRCQVVPGGAAGVSNKRSDTPDTHLWLMLPLSADEAVSGVLAVARPATNAPFTQEDIETARIVADTASTALENTRLRQRIENGYLSTVLVLAGAIDAKDPYTQGHSRRVAGHAVATGMALKLQPDTMRTLEYAAILHDAGKIGISDAILSKPGRLSADERAIIEDHPVIGAAIVRRVPFLEDTVSIILHHHERYDGKGYPHGLGGADIPLGARTVAVADSFDTMTTDRPYQRGRTINEAMLELHRQRGRQFCPLATDAFAAGFSLHRDATEQRPSVFAMCGAAAALHA